MSIIPSLDWSPSAPIRSVYSSCDADLVTLVSQGQPSLPWFGFPNGKYFPSAEQLSEIQPGYFIG